MLCRACLGKFNMWRTHHGMLLNATVFYHHVHICKPIKGNPNWYFRVMRCKPGHGRLFRVWRIANIHWMPDSE